MLVWLLLHVVVEISCWQQGQRIELHGTHFSGWWLLLVFISFSLLWMVLAPMICFRLMPFLKAIMGSVLKVFLQLWFACNMWQCLVRISFNGNARLYTTDNSIHCLSWRFCLWSRCFQSSWSTFWICCMTTSFLYPLSTNCSTSFLEWLW